MTSTTPQRDTATHRTESRLARTITDQLEPKNWIIVISLLIGWATSGVTGLAWGGVSALFAAVIPALIIKKGIRAGRWADRHLSARQHRLIVMALILTSVATGIALMLVANAPRTIIALTVAMFATLAILAVITTRWKISVHAAVAAGASIMLAMAFAPAILVPLTFVVALVGWSRVALRDHSLGQVIAGALLGMAIAGLTFAALG